MKIRAVRAIGCLLAATLLFTSVPVSAYTGEENGVFLQEEETAEADAAVESADEDGSGEAWAVSDAYEEEEAWAVNAESEAETDEESDDELLSEDASENAEDSEKEDEEPLNELLYPEEDDADDFATSDDFEDEIPDEMTDDGDYDEFLAASGTEPGTGIKWSYSDDGTLTLSGSGAIRDYYNNSSGSTPTVDNRPWVSYWKKAKKLVVSEGITRIGHRAFQCFEGLESAELPNSLKSVGQYAFQECFALNDIVMPENVTLESGAFDAVQTENSLYKSSDYYKNLTQVSLTGNYRDDVIAVAKSQIGYHEGNSEADYAGGNTSGSGDVTEYGRYLVSSGNAWCSEFASWCIRMAGVPKNLVNSSRGANAYSFTYDTSAKYYTWSETTWAGGTYTPGKGDVILWVWKDSSVTYAYNKSLSHTTILESATVSGNNVKLSFVNGNSGNQVKEGSYTVSKSEGKFSEGYVGYFVSPNYEENVTKYTVTFNANGGTTPKSTKKVANGGVYGPLPIPTNGTKEFLGWFNTNGKRINMYTPCLLTNSETLTARWKTPDLPEVTIPTEYLRDGADATSIKAVSGTLKNSGEFGEGISSQIYTYTANNATYRALYIWGENGNGSIGKGYETVKTIYSSEKDSLTDIILDDSIVKVEQERMFSNLSKVSYVRLSENLEELAGRDFQSCTALPEITFPASLKETGMNTIDGCTSLKTMTFEQGIKKIPDHIADCDVVASQIALETVNIPSSVTEIGISAFEGQKKLTTVNFLDPAKTTLARIADFAFLETNLSSITLPKFGGFWYDTSHNKRYPEISGRVFDQKQNKAFNTIIIPEGVVNLYEFTHSCEFEYIYLPSTIECNIDKGLYGFSNSIFYDGDDSAHKALKKIYYPGSESQFLTKALGAKLPSAVENYKSRFWYKLVEFNTKAPTQIESIAAESDSVVFYYDDVKEGQSNTVTLAITPANHLSTAYKVTTSDKEIVEASIGGEDNGFLALILRPKKERGTATVTITGGFANCKINVVIKDKDPANKPKAKLLSGNGNEYGDKWGLLSPTPYAQIFYIIDENESVPVLLKNSSNYNYNEDTKKYSPKISSIKEYKGNPLVVGTDLTESKHHIHAVAIRHDLSFSEPLDKTIKSIIADDAWGDVKGDDREQFSGDAAKIPDGIWIPRIQLAGLTYTGKAITIPDLRVYYKNKLLVLKQDYTLKYSNNTDARGNDEQNPPSVTITLTGNYSGSKTIPFSIGRKGLTGSDITYMDAYLNEKISKGALVEQDADLKIKYQGKALKAGKDFTVGFRMHKKASGPFEKKVSESGIYDAMITFSENGNYSGSFKINSAVYVLGADLVRMDKVQVSSISAQMIDEKWWNGEEYRVEPVYSVKYKNNAVTTAQYKPKFINNNAAGTATLILTGTGNPAEGSDVAFVGTKTVTFKIKGLPFDDKNVTVTGIEKKYTYNGSAIEPAFSVKYKDGKSITSDSSKNGYYKASYNNDHTSAGKVTVTIEGAGIYEGKVKRDFTIEKLPIDGAAVSVYNGASDREWKDSEEEFTYTKNGVKPAVTVKFDGKVLSPSDYTITYKNNNKPAGFDATDNRDKSIAPTIILAGKGSFQGTRTLTYTINASALSDFDMALEDMVYTNAPKKYARKPVITDKNGVVLREGTDYDKNFIYTYDKSTYITRTEGKGKSAKTTLIYKNKGEEVSDLDIINPGSVIRVKVYAKDGGCYTESIEDTFTVAENSIKDLKFSISKTYIYTGRPITPLQDDIEVQKKNGAKWEKLAADDAKEYYEIVSYSNNIKKGTGNMVVKAKNGYAGTAKITFKIDAKK